jgi:hypothetical protein
VDAAVAQGRLPFTREWHVPTEKVITDLRQPVPPDVMESLFWQTAGPLIAGGEPSAVMLGGRPVAAADGMLVNLADTPANRAFFGSTGTAEGSARSRSCGGAPGACRRSGSRLFV